MRCRTAKVLAPTRGHATWRSTVAAKRGGGVVRRAGSPRVGIARPNRTAQNSISPLDRRALAYNTKGADPASSILTLAP
jgi:hypothetical protein